MAILQWASILLEIGIVLMGIKLVKQNKPYGLGILVTFSIYVFYDIAKYVSLPVSDNFLYFMFFVASLSAFWTVWILVKTKKS